METTKVPPCGPPPLFPHQQLQVGKTGQLRTYFKSLEIFIKLLQTTYTQVHLIHPHPNHTAHTGIPVLTLRRHIRCEIIHTNSTAQKYSFLIHTVNIISAISPYQTSPPEVYTPSYGYLPRHPTRKHSRCNTIK